MRLRPTSESVQRAFALVIALVLMAFIALLLLGLNLMTTVEVQSQRTVDLQRQARDNARLGVLVALGQLQSLTGADQRITAPGSLEDSAPEYAQGWVGVWNPDRSATGDAGYGKRMGWLVSGKADGSATDFAVGRAVVLKDGSGALSQVEVPLVAVGEGASTSRYGYAVFDESMKARLGAGGHRMRSLLEGESPDSKQMLGGASGVSPSVVLGEWTEDALLQAYQNLEQVMSHRQLEGLSTAPSESAFFRHYTPYSLGVAADARRGGLRADLSLAFEMDGNTSATTGLSRFNNSAFAGNGSRTAADPTSAIERNHGESFFARYLFAVPVDNGVNDASGDDIIRGPSWHALRDYYNLYKEVRGGTGSSPSLTARALFPNQPQVPAQLSDPYKSTTKALTDFERWQGTPGNATLWAGDSGANEYASSRIGGSVGYLNRPTRGSYFPVLQRVVYNFSLINYGGDIGIMMTPVVVLWNPYNVQLEVNGLKVIQDNLPIYFHIRLERDDGSVAEFLSDYRSLYRNYGGSSAANSRDLQLLTPEGAGAIRFAPGEVKVFSLADTSPTDYASAMASGYTTPTLYLAEGIRYGGGAVFRRFRKLASLTNGIPAFVGGATDYESIVLESTASANPVSPLKEISLEVYNAFTKDVTSAPVQVDEIGYGVNNNYWLTHLYSLGADSFPNTIRGPWRGDDHVSYLHVPLMHGGTKQIYFDLSVAEQTLQGSVLAAAPNVPLDVFAIDVFNRASRDGSGGQLLENINPRAAARSVQMSNHGEALPAQMGMSVQPHSSMAGLIQSSGSSGFWGDSLGSTGSSRVIGWEVPTRPLLSLAALQHADVSLLDYHTAHAIGNSRASAYLPLGKTWEYQTRGTSPSRYSSVYDLSYYANEALWDAYFFSGIAPRFTGSGNYQATETLAAAINRWADSAQIHADGNPRMLFYAGQDADVAAIRTQLQQADGYQRTGANVLIEGAFNVNSLSVEAWKQVLGALQNIEVDYATAAGNSASEQARGSVFSRLGLPRGNSEDLWLGFRQLSDAELTALAGAVVEQVKTRGPFLSLADFVNRGLENRADADEPDTRLAGALQTAIDQAGLNTAHATSGVAVSNTSGLLNAAAVAGRSSLEGMPGMLSQADILTAIGPHLAVRGDTFVIRSYGDVVDPATGEVLAKAWCEALVQRVPDYFDAAANKPWERGSVLSAENQRFGREYSVLHFWWLNDDDV